MNVIQALQQANSLDALRESVFSATNPTPLTGIAVNNDPTALAATEAILNIYNSADPNAADGTQNIVIVPVSIRLRATTINTSGTSYQIVGYLDVINRYSSGGTLLTGVPNFKTAKSGWTARTAKATVHFGDLTLAAASSAARVFNQQISDVIYAADDQVYLEFGGENAGENGNLNIIPLPLIQIGPGCNLSIHPLSPSSTADMDPEITIQWVELHHPSLLAA